MASSLVTNMRFATGPFTSTCYPPRAVLGHTGQQLKASAAFALGLGLHLLCSGCSPAPEPLEPTANTSGAPCPWQCYATTEVKTAVWVCFGNPRP